MMESQEHRIAHNTPDPFDGGLNDVCELNALRSRRAVPLHTTFVLGIRNQSDFYASARHQNTRNHSIPAVKPVIRGCIFYRCMYELSDLPASPHPKMLLPTRRPCFINSKSALSSAFHISRYSACTSYP